VKCRKCGRPLTAPGPRRPYGPVCWARLSGPVAALEASGNPAAARAALLLRTGSLAPVRGHGGRVYRTLSTRGIAVYLTAPEACNCAAGLYGKLCYHRVAVTVLLAA
jgi:hypothetical protein